MRQVADGHILCREEEPLFKAIHDGDASRVKTLVMRPGTNLMLPSKPGWLAIHQAAWYGQDACLRVLLSGRYIYAHTQTHTNKHITIKSRKEKSSVCVFLFSSAGDDQQANGTR